MINEESNIINNDVLFKEKKYKNNWTQIKAVGREIVLYGK
jgi:hypothetical protein